jgi:hypothetical protein
VADFYYTSDEQYKHPCFNPNNSDEFIYYYSNTSTHQYQLRKYNLESKENSLVLDDIRIIGKPAWGKNDWIIFNNHLVHIWKIKSNGDSLSPVSIVNHNQFINWDSSNNIVFVFTEKGGVPHNVVSKDFYSGICDTIYIGDAGYLNVSNDNSIATANDHYNIEISSISNINNWTNLTNIEHGSGLIIIAICWHPNSNSIYYSRTLDGLYYIDINEKVETKFKETCSSKIYECITISPDGKRIVVERINSYYAEYGLFRDSKIYIMDIDGCNERELVLN